MLKICRGFLAIAIGSLLLDVRAQAAIIASDQFLTNGSPNYTVGNLNTQTTTGGTIGYYTGAAAGSQVAGWNSGTGSILSEAGGLSHPLLVNVPAALNDGKARAAGVSATRLQYRDLASATQPLTGKYYFSTLLQESSNSYTGTTYAGLGLSRASGTNNVTPNTGFNIGFSNGALTLFYNSTSAVSAYSTQTLLAAPTANSTYLVTVELDTAANTLTPTVYNAAGVVVNTPTAFASTIASNELGAFQLWVSSQFTGSAPANVYFDEFRFGTALSDVVAIPEPSTFVLGGFLLFGMARAGLRRRHSV